MRTRNLIFGFLARFVFLYGMLIAPWPGFKQAYGHYFRALGQMVFSKGNDRRILNFEKVPQALGHLLDTRIALSNRELLDRRGNGPVRYLELDSRGIGWIPTGLIVALILATPIPWRRRGWALLSGLIAIHAFILFSLTIYIWDNSTELSLLVLNSFWKTLFDELQETFITQLGPGFAAPVLLWILVTLRREDVAAWRNKDYCANLRTSPKSDLTRS